MLRKDDRIVYIIFMIGTLLFCLNYSPSKSYACSCAQPPPVQTALQQSKAVFSGKVIQIVDENKNSLFQSSADSMMIVFEVKEWWKGGKSTEVKIYTERDSASCGYEFVLNEEYLVYAPERDGQLQAELCSRTNFLGLAQDDLKELGAGIKPNEEKSEKIEQSKVNKQENNSNNGMIIVSAIMILSLLVVIVFIMRKRSKKD